MSSHPEQKRVVYLPDCNLLKKDFLRYLRAGLLLGIDNKTYQEQIARWTEVEDIYKFCEYMAGKRQYIYFVIDQLNALESDDGEDETKLSWIREQLERITFCHYIIKSASANHRMGWIDLGKERHQYKAELFGGLSEV